MPNRIDQVTNDLNAEDSEEQVEGNEEGLSEEELELLNEEGEGSEDEGEEEDGDAEDLIDVDGTSITKDQIREALKVQQNVTRFNQANTQRAQELAEYARGLQEREKELLDHYRSGSQDEGEEGYYGGEEAGGQLSEKHLKEMESRILEQVRSEREQAEQRAFEAEYARRLDQAIVGAITESPVLNEPGIREMVRNSAITYMYDNRNADPVAYIKQVEKIMSGRDKSTIKRYVTKKRGDGQRLTPMPKGGGPARQRQQPTNTQKGFEKYVDRLGRNMRERGR